MLAKVVLLASVITYCHGMSNMLDVIAANNGSMMVSLIKKAGLAATFSGPGPFTVLVPVDAAFAALPTTEFNVLTTDVDKLAKVLKHHIIAGERFDFDLTSGQIVISLIGEDISLYKKGDDLYYNGAKVVGYDLEASNGVVYLIDRVLNVPEGTIMNILDSPDYNLTEFASMVRRSHLDTVLNSRTKPDRYTLFVPSNAAFYKLPETTRIKLFSTEFDRHIKEIVDYHVHLGVLNIKTLDHNALIKTRLRGHNIRVDIDTGNIRFNGRAILEESNIKALNGVVHVIDNVLLPVNLGHIIG